VPEQSVTLDQIVLLYTLVPAGYVYTPHWYWIYEKPPAEVGVSTQPLVAIGNVLLVTSARVSQYRLPTLPPVQ